jgi:predicted ATP-binding protein involved in virulence
MKIQHVEVRNFKGFEHKKFMLHPHFNLIVGRNGTGKTSALDAIAVAIGSWFLGLRGADSRHIKPTEVLLKTVDQTSEFVENRFEAQYPCEVSAEGTVLGELIPWSRTLGSQQGRTTYVGARRMKDLAAMADEAVRAGEPIDLPLICYYGTGRLWQEPREAFIVAGHEKIADKKELSRLAGYKYSIDPKLSVAQFTTWMARQSWISFKTRNISPHYEAIKAAIVSCIEGAEGIEFDPGIGEVIVKFQNGYRPFSLLSDGQRCMLAMIGDLAQKAVALNPHFGVEILERTPGVVLIDELDLHLHPQWQRRVIEDLRRLFKNVQFICTTHSPFLIQSLRSGEELLMLDGQPLPDLANLSIETIAECIQGVSNTQTSKRYADEKDFARDQLETIESATELPPAEQKKIALELSEQLEKFSSDPAFQAFLEMKRIAKLGQ